MLTALTFVGIGYLSGSILFARLAGKLMKKDLAGASPDGNPGAFNAFRYGGFWCGVLTLCGDLCKGFLPVYLYLRTGLSESAPGLSLVLAAPVLGHVFPLYYGFRGGKGIAVTFGCLLGLLPEYRPVLILALVFIFFSVVFQINPHYYRTLGTYLLTMAGMALFVENAAVRLGFLLITGLVAGKLLMSGEEKEKFEVKLLWKHY